jgi:ABC-type lipoprotein release transport system permease subunit
VLIPLSYNLRSLFVRRSATLLTVLGVGATVAIVSGVLALQQGFKTMFIAGGRPDVAIFLRPGANGEGDSQFSRDRGLKLIKSVPEIAVDPENGPIASMEAYLAVLLSPVRGGVTNVPLRGVQPMTFEIRKNELRIVEGKPFAPGNDELIVGNRLVGRIAGCRIGEVIALNKTPFRVVGVFEHDGQFGGEIWGDLDRVVSAMGRYGPNRIVAQLVPGPDTGSSSSGAGDPTGAPDPMLAFQMEDPERGIEKILAKYVEERPVATDGDGAKMLSKDDVAKETTNRLLHAHSDWRALLDMAPADLAAELGVAAKGEEAAEKVRAYLADKKVKLDPRPGSLADRLRSDTEVPAKVISEKQFLESQTVMLTGMLGGLAFMLGLIMGLAAIFTATNTMLSAIAARSHEIGILLAMGYRPVPVFLSFMFEALVLGLIGGVVGCLMSLPFNGIRAGTMNFQTFTEMAFAFKVTPFVLAIAIVFSLLLGLFGGALPAWRAARLTPTEAMRRG